MKGVKSRSAPGRSGMPAVVFKAIAQSELLCGSAATRFSEFVKGMKIPPFWLKGEMVLIPKGADHTQVLQHRPLTMLEGSYKWYTKALMARLNKFMDENHLWADAQAGFRAGKGTPINALLLAGVAEQARREHRQLLVLYLDWKKAFDSVPHEVIRWALKGMGMPEDLVRSSLGYTAGTRW